MKNRPLLNRTALLLFVSLTALCLAPAGTGFAQTDNSGDQPKRETNPDEIYQQLNLFGDVFERVRDDYVDEVEDAKLVEHALNGLLTNLDPHSGYLNDDDFKDMQVQTKGEFGGLGIEVTMDNGVVKVVSPIDDTPAFRAGVQAGDFITHLDGKPIVGVPLNEAVDQMRGKPGTDLGLTIRREGTTGPVKMVIKRDIIKIVAVKHRVEGDVGYIRITTFNRNTTDLLEDAIDAISKKLDKSLLGYVIDLRNNPGGLLDQAVSVADAFLERGEIVSTRGRHAKDNKRDNASSGDDTNGLPLVVLINGGSASASEIVAGALQDHRRAIIVGTKSFGKGSVQTVIPIPGHGAIRLTTARYYTPSGRSIQAKGIEPDIFVEQAKIEAIENDNLSEADLKGALKNPNDAPAPRLKDESLQELDKLREISKEQREGGNHPKLSAEAEKDYQLLRAIDLVRGLALYAPGGAKAVMKSVEPAVAEEAAEDANGGAPTGSP